MKNPRINQRIRVVDEKTGLLSERVYRIVQVNSADRSLIAIDDFGPEGVSIHWELCAEATPQISWDWIRSQVPQDVWALLSAFDGWEEVCLKPEVGADVLRQTPDLWNRILRAHAAQQAERGREKRERARRRSLLRAGSHRQSQRVEERRDQAVDALRPLRKKDGL